MLILHSCDPVGTTVNWTISYDRFIFKNFESGRLVWIPRYFGTLFCWFSAPVIQWALQRIETSFVIGSLAKNLSLVARLDSTLYWDHVLLIFRYGDRVGTTVNCTFSYDWFRCKNFESGTLFWIPRYFGTLFCWFSASVIQWALQWIEPSVVIGSVGKNLSLECSFEFHGILGPIWTSRGFWICYCFRGTSGVCDFFPADCRTW